jgi:type II secretory pathway component PulM
VLWSPHARQVATQEAELQQLREQNATLRKLSAELRAEMAAAEGRAADAMSAYARLEEQVTLPLDVLRPATMLCTIKE